MRLYRDMEASSLKELQQELSEIGSAFLPANAGERQVAPTPWYRGQSDWQWGLLPGLLRYENGLLEETRLYRDYDDPLPSKEALAGKDWERLFEMQHYNVPTRLLDWTTILNVALLNAVGAFEDLYIPERPGLFVLNPRSLGLRKLPDGAFSYEREYLRETPDGHIEPPTVSRPFPIDPTPTMLNDRLRVQGGRFTIHGSDPRALEEQLDDPHFVTVGNAQLVLARIRLTKDAILECRKSLEYAGHSARTFYPDFEGRAIALRARMQKVEFKAERDRIRLALRAVAERGLAAITGERSAPANLSSIRTCAFGDDFMSRSEEVKSVNAWLGEEANVPLLFLSGEAGSGKTNLLLQLVLDSVKPPAGRTRPQRWVAFVAARDLEAPRPDRAPIDLMQQILQGILAKLPNHCESEAWRQMVTSGDALIILDGLDELARTQGADAVQWVIRQLDHVLEQSTRAHIIISCRDHILRRLEGGKVLTFTTRTASSAPRPKRPGSIVVKMGALDDRDMETFIERTLPSGAGVSRPSAKAIIDYVRRAKFNHNPLFLKILLDVHKDRGFNEADLQLASNAGKAIDQWFRWMVEGQGSSGATLDPMSVFADVAQCMLDRRTDVVGSEVLMQTLGSDGFRLVEKYTADKAGRAFSIFTKIEGKQDEKGTSSDLWAFAHQSLREFVLARALFTCIERDDGDGLLSRTEALDFEGRELYGYVADLLEGRKRGLADAILTVRGVHRASKPPKGRRPSLNQTKIQRPWNNRLRNLFEASGILTASGDPRRDQVIEKAVGLLATFQEPRPTLRYMTALNLVRCLERLHVSAPTPYLDFVGVANLRKLHEQPKVGKADGPHWTVDRAITAYALRGFHLATRSIEGNRMCFLKNERGTVRNPQWRDKLEDTVTGCLLDLMERMARLDELPLDAEYLWINCSNALIRWLPWGPSPQANRLVELMDQPAFARSSTLRETAVNVFWTLFLRGTDGSLLGPLTTKLRDLPLQLGQLDTLSPHGSPSSTILKNVNAYVEDAY